MLSIKFGKLPSVVVGTTYDTWIRSLPHWSKINEFAYVVKELTRILLPHLPLASHSIFCFSIPLFSFGWLPNFCFYFWYLNFLRRQSRGYLCLDSQAGVLCQSILSSTYQFLKKNNYIKTINCSWLFWAYLLLLLSLDTHYAFWKTWSDLRWAYLEHFSRFVASHQK